MDPPHLLVHVLTALAQGEPQIVSRAPEPGCKCGSGEVWFEVVRQTWLVAW
jgi:hypothetical protein